MANNLQISGINTYLTEDLALYVHKKIGQLDKYVPKKARESLKTEVKLKEHKTKRKENFLCEVIMHLPKDLITVKENSSSFIAAIDLTENRMKVRLKKYKETHGGPRFHRRLINRAANK
jgi:ribosomal subunit interface protein